MKKILIISAAVLALAGCAKEVAQVERTTIDGKEYMTFKVAIDDDVISADTKSTVSRTGVFAWEDGDPVYFVDASNNTAEGVFSESATTITVEAGDWISASTAQFTSKTQLNFNNVKGPVIAAQVSGGELHFHHVGSVINVKIADIPYDCTLVLWPNGDQKWGNGSFSFDGEGKPSLDSGSGNIYITKEVTPADEGKDIAISVPNLNYTSGFSVNLKKGDNIFLQKWTNTARDLSTRPTLLNMAQIEPQTLTVAGANAIIFGTSWAPSLTDNDMELGEDGVWRKSYPYTPDTSLEFKVALDHSWGASWGTGDDNYIASTLTIGKGFVVCFTFPEGVSGGISHEQIDTYTVVGSSGLCGVNWEDKDGEENPHWESTIVNDMTEISSGVYYKKLIGVSAGTYEFKVVKNHSWGVSWGADGGNFIYTAPAGDVEIYFDTNKPNNPISITGYTPVYIVAGQPQELFNNNYWDVTAEDNKMVLQPDGTYSVSFYIDKTAYDASYDSGSGTHSAGFKVAKDKSWGIAKPADNYWINLDLDKTLTITYNVNTGDVTAVVE